MELWVRRRFQNSSSQRVCLTVWYNFQGRRRPKYRLRRREIRLPTLKIDRSNFYTNFVRVNETTFPEIDENPSLVSLILKSFIRIPVQHIEMVMSINGHDMNKSSA
jgi:hypothetical protein